MRGVRTGRMNNLCIETFEKYILCEKFGWLPSQMEEEDSVILREFMIILQESNRLDQEKMKEAEVRSKRR